MRCGHKGVNHTLMATSKWRGKKTKPQYPETPAYCSGRGSYLEIRDGQLHNRLTAHFCLHSNHAGFIRYRKYPECHAILQYHFQGLGKFKSGRGLTLDMRHLTVFCRLFTPKLCKSCENCKSAPRAFFWARSKWARWAHPTRSGSQSGNRIRFIFPRGAASYIKKYGY